MDPERASGGILKLRELIEEHPSEFAYDFRKHFNISAEQIGYAISYREAVLLVAALMRDPSSALQAARNGWDHPVSREWMVMANIVDVLVAVNSKKKSKPSKRPWPDPGLNRLGKKNQSREDVIARLNEMNRREPNG